MEIDNAKVEADTVYGDLKGHLVNTSSRLPPRTIINQYRNLWQVERAFRLSKSDLKERPIYHSKPRRIKSHFTLCFVSLLVVKEAERILAQEGYSLKQAIEQLS